MNMEKIKIIEQGDKRREELIKLQEKLCEDNKIPYFAEYKQYPGYCWKCKKNIVTEEWAKKLITGCPECHISYCD